MIDAGSKLFALGATLMPFGSIIAAAPDSVQSAAASPAVPGWTEFLDGLRDLPDRVLARLPPEQRNDPQIQEEVGRLALSAVTAAAIDALASDPDHPVFIPQINNYITLGQPNADTSYGYSGSWWQLDPTTDTLLVRMVGSDWDKELEPTLSIERLDVPASRPRLPAKALEQKLRSIPAAADFIAPLLVDRPEKLRTEGYLNKLKEVDLSRMGGLAGQFYYEGAYALKDDEALILETSVPEKCAYRSLILTNDVYETTDWYNNNSSLNGAQAPADNDGILRIVVSARDPGVPNWLDTAGYQTGVIQGRWLDCSSQPVPSVKKVLLKDVRKSLPAATPEISAKERDEQVRDRRAALQQRPLW